MRTKPVTYTIPKDLDAALHARFARGQMSKFVTQALWDALKKEEDALIKEFLEADQDPGNADVKQSFSKLESEDFMGIECFDFEDKSDHEKLSKKRRGLLGSTRSRRRKRN
jgi:hypothetical protein